MFENLRKKARNTKIMVRTAAAMTLTSKSAEKLMIVARFAMLALSCVMMAMLLLSGQLAFAADPPANGSGDAGANANSLFTLLFKIIGAMVLILGIIFGLLGIVHYVTANSEGDGPAKQKAMLQLASGIMLVALGIILMNGAIMQQFSNMITGTVNSVGETGTGTGTGG